MAILITLHRNGRLQDPERLWDSRIYNNTKKDLVQELNSFSPEKASVPLKPGQPHSTLQADRPVADRKFTTL